MLQAFFSPAYQVSREPVVRRARFIGDRTLNDIGIPLEPLVDIGSQAKHKIFPMIL